MIKGSCKWLSTVALCLTSFWTCAWATVYDLPADGSAVLGTDIRVKITDPDPLFDVARRYGLGYPEIIRANPGVDIWSPGEGREILLPSRRILPPAPHEGIVVNLPEHRLYYYPKPTPGKTPVVITYPVSIGRMDWRSPLGETWIIGKERHPNWYPPESIRRVRAAHRSQRSRADPGGPRSCSRGRHSLGGLPTYRRATGRAARTAAQSSRASRDC